MFKPKPPSLANALGLQSSVTVVKSQPRDENIEKAEQELLRSKALTVEDGDQQVTSFEAAGKEVVIRPPYNPFQLCMLVQTNNTLMQCITAMEVNIDGTGYEVERRDGKQIEDGDETAKQIKQFFDEPYPGESFVTQRRKLRRDLESIGNAYIEVLRSADGTITFQRVLDAKLMRLCKLEKEPYPVTREVERHGKTLTVKSLERPRKFAMWIGSTLHYFKEFGVNRTLNAKTGVWDGANGGDEATEVIHLTVFPDVNTMYGVPRWINQIPSVLGSRKAEEFNLEFFNAGGLPPAMILVQGGQLSSASREALTNYLAGKAKFKQRGVIAEIFSSGGSLDGSGGSVKVTVERFGDERQKDSMFEKYDERCGNHVRQAFRLPQLFVGNSQDQNFATAQASYIVAEAQVFKPEREEFDEIINVKIMRELWPDYFFRSLPMSMNDVTNQLKALEMVKDMADSEKFVEQVNEVGAINVTLREGYDDEKKAENDAKNMALKMRGQNPDAVDEEGNPVANKVPIAKVQVGEDGKIAKMDDTLLVDLAQDWADYSSGRAEFSDATVESMRSIIDGFSAPVRTLFNSQVAERMVAPVHDPRGVGELIGCATDITKAEHPEGCGCGAH